VKPVARIVAGICVLLALSRPAGGRDDRLILFPKLRAGATLTYLIRYHSEKVTKSESRVVSPVGPDDSQVEARGLLRIEVLEVQQQGPKAIIHARSEFQSLNSGLGLTPADPRPAPPDAKSANGESKVVEFTILPDGKIQGVKGLDALFPEQRQIWQEWVAQFALGGVLPEGGLKVGEKWKTEESESAASLIAGLTWNKQGTYVRDEPCRPVQVSVTGDIVTSDQKSEECAVLLIQATLKQKTSSKDTTPPDFKLHALRTSGTAHGNNETITYISLSTGLVVRATEDANQSMDVRVAKSDGSNHVHYNVDGKSHAEVLLVAETIDAKP
jgi:hypothetical protein